MISRRINLYILIVALNLNFIQFLHAEDKQDSIVEIQEHLHTLTLTKMDNAAIEKIKNIIVKSINDDSEACKGFIIKTPNGVIKFRKFKPKKNSQYEIPVKVMAYQELRGGCAKVLQKIGFFIDKQINKTNKAYHKSYLKKDKPHE